MDKPQLTYRDLCEGAIIQIWPCTEWDLLELWSTIDPTNQGCVLLGDVVANLGGARPTSPSPGPARYSPLQAERLTMNKYQLPSMERCRCRSLLTRPFFAAEHRSVAKAWRFLPYCADRSAASPFFNSILDLGWAVALGQPQCLSSPHRVGLEIPQRGRRVPDLAVREHGAREGRVEHVHWSLEIPATRRAGSAPRTAVARSDRAQGRTGASARGECPFAAAAPPSL